MKALTRLQCKKITIDNQIYRYFKQTHLLTFQMRNLVDSPQCSMHFSFTQQIPTQEQVAWQSWNHLNTNFFILIHNSLTNLSSIPTNVIEKVQSFLDFLFFNALNMDLINSQLYKSVKIIYNKLESLNKFQNCKLNIVIKRLNAKNY